MTENSLKARAKGQHTVALGGDRCCYQPGWLIDLEEEKTVKIFDPV